MKNWKERLLKWNFKKVAVICLIAALMATVAGGALMGAGILPSRYGYDRIQMQSRLPGIGQSAICETRGVIQYGQDDGKYDSNYGYGRHDRGMGQGMSISAYHRNHMRPFHMGGLSGLQRTMFLSFGAFGIFLFLGLRVLLAAWIAQKALKAGLQPIFWGIATLIFHIYAVVIFFLYRGFQNRCPACGKVQKKDCQFCTACGAALQETCPNCGAMMEVGGKYCAGCGHKKG